MNKYVYILHGVSGCGKSTVAEALTTNGGVICCADDGFIVNGNYVFDANKLGYCHNQCQEKFAKALIEERSIIVVANTNTKPSEWKFYEETAKQNGYIVFHLIVENRHGGKDTHNVPAATLEKQAMNIRNNLKLI
jgi:predicted ABC-type ATPase